LEKDTMLFSQVTLFFYLQPCAVILVSVEFWKEVDMSLYALVVAAIVLGLFIVISVLPVFFTEQDFESLVLLPE
jgi:hypothetical protein